MRFTIEEIGVGKVERELLGVEARALDMAPALVGVATQMRASERELFATSGASGGQPWEELAESTLTQKAAKGYPEAILIATSDLEASLTEKGEGNVEHVSPHELIFGSSIEYGRFHRDGTVKMPKRDPLDFSEVSIRAWTRELQAYLVGVDRAAFGPGAR